MKRYLVFILFCLCSLMTIGNALNVGFSTSTNSNVESDGINMNLDLDYETEFHSNAVASEGTIFSDTTVSGNGSNNIAIGTPIEFVAAKTENVPIKGNIETSGGLLSANVKLDEFQAMDESESSNGLMMSVDGLYERGSGKSASLLTGPALTATGGNSNAYVLTGYRWNTKDPQLKLTLKTDSNLAGESLSTSAVQGAIAAAANTWDDATNQNLFADSGLVTLSSTVATDKRDYKNTLAWKYLSDAPCALAYARTWYSYYKVDGYKNAVESDISFNTRYAWKTDGSGNYDVQSVALHELGHTIGLGDLYGLTKFAKDTDQIMHYYDGIQRTLGNGDKTGVWMMYDSGLNYTMAAKGLPS